MGEIGRLSNVRFCLIADATFNPYTPSTVTTDTRRSADLSVLAVNSVGGGLA